MGVKTELIVFSDLDGTLLDHETYSWHAAKPALARLAKLNAGLVLASSKTGREIKDLQSQIGCTDWPAIVENGAGILWPGANQSAQDDQYDTLRNLIKSIPNNFQGFGDMSAAQVAAATGLSEQAASRAKDRRFSEPGIWTGSKSELDQFLSRCADHGISGKQGGRFLTLSFGTTKADGMRKIIQTLQPSRTIALGDAPNDAEMLMLADQGAIIRNEHGPGISALPGEEAGKIMRTKAQGPIGWAEAIAALTQQDTTIES